MSTPASLALELAETARNGNWSTVRETLRSLTPAQAAATAFYVCDYCDPEDVGRMGRLLSDDVQPFEAP